MVVILFRQSNGVNNVLIQALSSRQARYPIHLVVCLSKNRNLSSAEWVSTNWICGTIEFIGDASSLHCEMTTWKLEHISFARINPRNVNRILILCPMSEVFLYVFHNEYACYIGWLPGCSSPPVDSKRYKGKKKKGGSKLHILPKFDEK